MLVVLINRHHRFNTIIHSPADFDQLNKLQQYFLPRVSKNRRYVSTIHHYFRQILFTSVEAR